MELCKNIFFNTDKLTENSEVKISYTGRFFEGESREVYLHYGFGESWENTTDVKMEKTDLGYQATILLSSSDALSLCFRNSDNEWDNNDGANYVFSIEKAEDILPQEEVEEETSLTLVSPRKLRKSYMLTKKIKLLIYKIIKYVPKLIS